VGTPPMIDQPPPAVEAASLVSPATQPAAYSAPPETSLGSQSVSTLLSSAQSEMDNGKFLEARGELNDALQTGNLDPAQTASVKALLIQISQTVVFGSRRSPEHCHRGRDVSH